MTGPSAVVSTTYPEDPSTSLSLTWNDTEAVTTDSQDSTGGAVGGPGLWEVTGDDDPSHVAWSIVPSTGLLYPGESISVSFFTCESLLFFIGTLCSCADIEL